LVLNVIAASSTSAGGSGLRARKQARLCWIVSAETSGGGRRKRTRVLHSLAQEQAGYGYRKTGASFSRTRTQRIVAMREQGSGGATTASRKQARTLREVMRTLSNRAGASDGERQRRAGIARNAITMAAQAPQIRCSYARPHLRSPAPFIPARRPLTYSSSTRLPSADDRVAWEMSSKIHTLPSSSLSEHESYLKSIQSSVDLLCISHIPFR
jgi:hypothetical protein